MSNYNPPIAVSHHHPNHLPLPHPPGSVSSSSPLLQFSLFLSKFPPEFADFPSLTALAPVLRPADRPLLHALAPHYQALLFPPAQCFRFPSATSRDQRQSAHCQPRHRNRTARLASILSFNSAIPDSNADNDANADAHPALALSSGTAAELSSVASGSRSPNLFPLVNSPVSFHQLFSLYRSEFVVLNNSLSRLFTGREQISNSLLISRAEYATLRAAEEFAMENFSLGEKRLNGVAAECVALESELAEVKEEFDQVHAENSEIEEIYYQNGGLVFGGAKSLVSARALDENSVNFKEKLQATKEKCEKEKARNEMFRCKLTGFYAERDRLLTRIEILQQAVVMMHGGADEGRNDGHEKNSQNPAAQSRLPDDLRGPNSHPPSFPYSDLLPAPRVPEFLHFGGFYRNLHFSSDFSELRVKEIWSLKALADQKSRQMGENAMEFGKFVKRYFENRENGIQWKMREFAVNLLRSMENATDSTAANNSNTNKKKKSAKSKDESNTQNNNTNNNNNNSATESKDQPVVAAVSPVSASISLDFTIFRLCLFGVFHESHYSDLQLLFASLKEALARWDILGDENSSPLNETDNSRPAPMIRNASFIAANSVSLIENGDEAEDRDGFIEWPVFDRELRKFFPVKSGVRMAALLSLARSMSFIEFSSQIDSNILLRPLDEFNPSKWFQLIGEQYIEEIMEYRRIIRDAAIKFFREKSMKIHSKNHHQQQSSSASSILNSVVLTAKEYYQLLKRVDPRSKPIERLELVRRGCRDPFFSKNSECDLNKFIQNLSGSGLLVQSSHWNKHWENEKTEENEEIKQN